MCKKDTQIGIVNRQRVRYKQNTCIVCGNPATGYCTIDIESGRDDWISLRCGNDLCNRCKCPSDHCDTHYLSEDIKDIKDVR